MHSVVELGLVTGEVWMDVIAVEVVVVVRDGVVGEVSEVDRKSVV